MLKLAVIGKDVSASESPAIHSFLLPRMGESCVYDKISIPPQAFAERIGELLSRYDGLNVTIPFKRDILPYLKGTEGDAVTFGAVNTVLCRTRTGYNTDGYGFLLMLENAGVEVENKSVLVLGAGGAGRSCIKKLSEAGAKVSVYERDRERLLAVQAEFGGFTALSEVEIRPYDVILNCTGVGMHDTVGQLPAVRTKAGEVPLPEELLSQCGKAVDLIYVPERSRFLELSHSMKKPVLNGASMLFFQAYRADCIFLQRQPKESEAKALWLEYRKQGGNL